MWVMRSELNDTEGHPRDLIERKVSSKDYGGTIPFIGSSTRGKIEQYNVQA